MAVSASAFKVREQNVAQAACDGRVIVVRMIRSIQSESESESPRMIDTPPGLLRPPAPPPPLTHSLPPAAALEQELRDDGPRDDQRRRLEEAD